MENDRKSLVDMMDANSGYKVGCREKGIKTEEAREEVVGIKRINSGSVKEGAKVSRVGKTWTITKDTTRMNSKDKGRDKGKVGAGVVQEPMMEDIEIVKEVDGSIKEKPAWE